MAEGLAALDLQAVSREEVAKALADFDPVWDALVPREKASLLALLIERVEYDPATQRSAPASGSLVGSGSNAGARHMFTERALSVLRLDEDSKDPATRRQR